LCGPRRTAEGAADAAASPGELVSEADQIGDHLLAPLGRTVVRGGVEERQIDDGR